MKWFRYYLDSRIKGVKVNDVTSDDFKLHNIVSMMLADVHFVAGWHGIGAITGLKTRSARNMLCMKEILTIRGCDTREKLKIIIPKT